MVLRSCSYPIMASRCHLHLVVDHMEHSVAYVDLGFILCELHRLRNTIYIPFTYVSVYHKFC